jgi:hypothetical protein
MIANFIMTAGLFSVLWFSIAAATLTHTRRGH